MINQCSIQGVYFITFLIYITYASLWVYLPSKELTSNNLSVLFVLCRHMPRLSMNMEPTLTVTLHVRIQRGNRGSGPPGRSQVLNLSIEICIWTPPPWKNLDPVECWTPLEPSKIIVFLKKNKHWSPSWIREIIETTSNAMPYSLYTCSSRKNADIF